MKHVVRCVLVATVLSVEAAWAAPARADVAAPTVSGPAASQAQVHVEAGDANVQLMRAVGQSEFSGWAGRRPFSGMVRDYSVVCTAPCDTTLPEGAVQLALATEHGSAVETDEPSEIRGPSTLRGTIESHLGERITGLFILPVGVIAGASLVTAGFMHMTETCETEVGISACQSANHPSWAMMGPGIALMVVGVAVGIPLIAMHDRAHIDVVPLAQSSALRLPGTVAERPLPAGSEQGLALRFRF
ncbi:MAG: hypothetical protein FWD17_09260 [Polyangiaceae bacterium]|nr:hypothetical protein [Polyangiaceae bacterium]